MPILSCSSNIRFYVGLTSSAIIFRLESSYFSKVILSCWRLVKFNFCSIWINLSLFWHYSSQALFYYSLIQFCILIMFLFYIYSYCINLYYNYSIYLLIPFLFFSTFSISNLTSLYSSDSFLLLSSNSSDFSVIPIY